MTNVRPLPGLGWPMRTLAPLLLAAHPRRRLRLAWAFSAGTGDRLRLALAKGGITFQAELEAVQREVRAACDGKGPGSANASSPLVRLTAQHPTPARVILTQLDGWQFYLTRPICRDDAQRDALLKLWGGATARLLGAAIARDAKQLLDDREACAQLDKLGSAIAQLQRLCDLGAELDAGRLPFPQSSLARFNVGDDVLASRRRSPQILDLLDAEAKSVAKSFDEVALPLRRRFDDEATGAFITCVIEWQKARLANWIAGEYPTFGVVEKKKRLEPTWPEALSIAWRARRKPVAALAFTIRSDSN